MLFLSKRSNINQHSSGKNACLSIVGLLLALGIIAGPVGLIYGLIKGILLWTIIGGIVLGISVFSATIFILIIVLCLKN